MLKRNCVYVERERERQREREREVILHVGAGKRPIFTEILLTADWEKCHWYKIISLLRSTTNIYTVLLKDLVSCTDYFPASISAEK